MVQQKTLIEWTDRTWNPIRGCSPVSPGGRNCYASYTARRFSGKGRPFEGLVTLSGKWNGKVRFVPEKLLEPLHWRTPCRIFVNSMSDLFHSAVTNEQIASVFGVIAACPQHTFQILTKRPERALEWYEWISAQGSSVLGLVGVECPPGASGEAAACAMMANSTIDVPIARFVRATHSPWPLPNVQLVVSCETHRYAQERIPWLFKFPALVRGVSLEPLLGPVDLMNLGVTTPTGIEQWDALDSEYDDGLGCNGPKLDWVIVGCESGVGRRPCDVAWIRSIVDQCRTARVPVFVKQLSLGGKVSRDPSEWPEDLRVRMFAGQRWC